jgi:PKD repeat protein
MHVKYQLLTGMIFVSILFFMGCIDSNIAPKASFTMEPETISLDEPVSFTSTSVDEDGDITNVSWMINNQIIGYGNQITYQFNANGTYEITLKVTDNQQKTDQTSQTVYIGVTPSNLKQLFIGSWEWSGNNQTGIWTFYNNDTSVTTFTGMAGATVTDRWHYEITNQTEICFSEPSDPLLMEACYKFEFHDNFTILDFTYNGMTERWYKATD